MAQRVLVTTGAKVFVCDIAALAVFPASDHAKSVSGRMLPIDGDMRKAV
jgi:hypothetical protein